jgi:hypothetical protein
MGGRRGRSLMTGIMYPQDPLILADRIASRIHPKRSQFDYIILKDLSTTIARYAEKIYGTVLDYGCGLKPYVELFYRVKEYIGADSTIIPVRTSISMIWVEFLILPGIAILLSAFKFSSMFRMSMFICRNADVCYNETRACYS